MNSDTPKFDITQKPEKLFREKKELIIPEFSFSPEMENDSHKVDAEKRLNLVTGDNEVIASIYYDYPSGGENFLKIRTVAREAAYQGSNLTMNLYKRLIGLAKEKNLDGIKSDSVVQGGALAMWKKLSEEGYIVEVNESAEEKYDEFIKTYEEGKFFKEAIRVPSNESVFTLRL